MTAKSTKKTFTLSADPSVRYGQLVEAKRVIADMTTETLIDANDAGFSFDDLAAKAGIPRSTVWHAFKRLGLSKAKTPRAQDKADTKVNKKVSKKVTTRDTKPAKTTVRKSVKKAA